MSMFNDISWRSQDNEQECELNANLVSVYARRFSPGRWSFFGPGSEKKWYSTHDSKPQGECDRVAELMMITLSESGHPVFRSTSRPEERSKAKVVENCQYTIAPTRERLKLFFAQFFCVNKLSIYGAVSDLCEEYKSCHVRTGRLVLVGQSDPLFVSKSSLMKTPTLSTDDPAQEDLLQKYQERNGWRRTVLHDKGHRRVLTICRASDTSWVDFVKRWKIIWSERLDSREH